MLFDMYAEPDRTWSKMSCHYFIMGCVGEKSSGPDDSRVRDLFAEWDKDQDGKLQRDDFFGFYTKAARERP
jgi:Ca2+-binding EF-hand superfamily protein